MQETHRTKKSDLVLITIFCFLIYTPFIVGLIQKDQKISAVEKRALATFPPFPVNTAEVNKYPQEINTYYADHFGFRDFMTKKYYKLRNSFDKSTLSKDVTKGKDGWLFLGQTTPGYKRFSDPIGDAMNVNLYTEEQLVEFTEYISKLQEWLHNRGIEYLFVIAPNKHTIYFEKLPNGITRQNKESATDQLISAIRDRTTVRVVDLRQSLIDAKSKYQLYYKTDTHWNHHAANIAQFEIMKVIENMFPGKISPNLYKDSSYTINEKNNGDLCKYANMDPVTEDSPQPNFVEQITSRKDIEVNDRIFETTFKGGNLNALIFRDSFFEYLSPYFSRKFRKVTYIWNMLNYDQLNKYIKEDVPDIVIEEWVERTLPFVPKGKMLFSE